MKDKLPERQTLWKTNYIKDKFLKDKLMKEKFLKEKLLIDKLYTKDNHLKDKLLEDNLLKKFIKTNFKDQLMRKKPEFRKTNIEKTTSWLRHLFTMNAKDKFSAQKVGLTSSGCYFIWTTAVWTMAHLNYCSFQLLHVGPRE